MKKPNLQTKAEMNTDVCQKLRRTLLKKQSRVRKKMPQKAAQYSKNVAKTNLETHFSELDKT